MRGRVMSLYLLVFLGSTPIGGPIVGWVAETFNPRAGFVVGGVASIVGALGAAAVLLRDRRRRQVVDLQDTSLRGEPAAV